MADLSEHPNFENLLNVLKDTFPDYARELQRIDTMEEMEVFLLLNEEQLLPAMRDALGQVADNRVEFQLPLMGRGYTTNDVAPILEQYYAIQNMQGFINFICDAEEGNFIEGKGSIIVSDRLFNRYFEPEGIELTFPETERTGPGLLEMASNFQFSIITALQVGADFPNIRDAFLQAGAQELLSTHNATSALDHSIAAACELLPPDLQEALCRFHDTDQTSPAPNTGTSSSIYSGR